MISERRHIVAFGGGGFSMERGNPLLDDYVLGLTGKARPRVCFLPTASGDADHYVVRFYQEFAKERADASHLTLFRRDRAIPSVREHLLSQDLIYVGGGSLISLIGVWKAHGIDEIMREAWEAGVVLCGLSAGALCWFTDSVTAYYEAPERFDGMGFLPWSFTAHYDTEPERRDVFHRLLCAGMRPGYAADDGTALHFRGLALHRVVSSRPTAGASALRCGPHGVLEERIEARYLGEAEGRAGAVRPRPAAADLVAGSGPKSAPALA